ncbi:MAG: hypothetical protein ACE5GE_06115 [Phycisphaerae bacterium]
MRSSRRKSLRAKRHRGRRLHKYGDRDVLDFHQDPRTGAPTARTAGSPTARASEETNVAEVTGPEVVLTLGGEPVVIQVKPEPVGVPYGQATQPYSAVAPVPEPAVADPRLESADTGQAPSTPQPVGPARRRWFRSSIQGLAKRAQRPRVKPGGLQSLATLGRVARRPFSWRKFCVSAGLSSGVGSLALLLMHWVGR